MNRCPISYSSCGENRYSEKGLKLLASGLSNLNLLPYTAEEQRIEAFNRASKMSIQGVQPKWRELIDISFLSPEMKRKYHDLLNTRLTTLKLQ